MIGGQRVLAVVAARGGSKGLPRKNVLPCGGKPLVAWSVEAARGARLVDRAILSSDDPEIIAAARAAGCDVPFVRPAELASDTATMVDVVLHATDALHEVGDVFSWVALLQATSPLRTAEDVDGCLAAAEAAGAPSAVTVTEPAKSPYWMYRVGEDGRLRQLLPDVERAAARRQDLDPIHVLNGAVYVTRVDRLRQLRRFVDDDTVAYRMPPERSVDVDTALDLVLCRVLKDPELPR